MRKLTETKIVLASHNKGKLREIQLLLMPYEIKCLSAGELGIDEPDETENTFSGNARLKALAAAVEADLPAIADDSGLEVASLKGKPGIFSARWAGPQKDFNLAMRKINNRLKTEDRKARKGVPRAARFVCALSVAWPSGATENFDGHIDGWVCWPPRGKNGFGYDPIFIPNRSKKTFAEADPLWKHGVSHRAIAFRKFTQHLLEKR